MERILVMYEKMNTLTSELDAIGESPPEEKTELIDGLNTMINIHHCTFYHDKRCLYAYLNHRLNKLREYRWRKGELNAKEVSTLMSKEETKYFQEYDQLLNSYMQSSGFDLTANMFPPHDLYVEVVATEDYGEIVTTSGTVNLEKNSIHYLKLSDIEYLIRQGVLKVKKTN